jgi:hypothetical protein
MSHDKDLIALEQQRKKDLAQLHDPTISAQNYMTQQTERRKRLEADAAQARSLFEENRALQLEEKRDKQKQLAYEKMLKSETKAQKSARLERDRVKQLKRDNEISDIEKEKKDVIDEITGFFDEAYVPSSTYNESAVNKIILFREIGIAGYEQGIRHAYRCKVCMYTKEESLSLITIERHIHDQKDKHKQALLSIVEKDYDNVVDEKRTEWSREDSDPSYRNQKIDKELAALKGIKTVTPG